MISVKALFMLVLFVTFFVRCWAGSHGFLVSDSWDCCESSISEHYNYLDHNEDHHENHENHHNHDGEHFPSTDCSGCNLLEEGFVSVSVDITISTPSHDNLSSDWDNLNLRLKSLNFRANKLLEPPPRLVIEHNIMTVSFIVTTSAISVRGPNLV